MVEDEIQFDSKKHKYTRKGCNYTSVTTIIKKYTPEFDKDYWSLYKAIKAVLEKYGEWKDYKWGCGGWENVVSSYNSEGHHHASEIEFKKAKLLLQWQKNSKEATEKGSLVHEALENQIIQEHGGGKDAKTVKDIFPISKPEMLPVLAIIPEAMIWNDRYKIAGQVDYIERKNKKLIIKDYKTSKEITRVPFRDETLLYPLSHLPNANYYIYSMQLSLYGWMLEQFGYKVDKLSIEHRDRENGSLIDVYPVDYLKDEVVEMLNDYDQGIWQE